MATTRIFKPYTKTEIIEAIQSLPDDCTIDDAMERLYFLAKLETARAQIGDGKGIPHEQVVREMAEWRD